MSTAWRIRARPFYDADAPKCRLASHFAAADCILFLRPVTTSPSPRSWRRDRSWRPWLHHPCRRRRPWCRSARRKNSVSVAPGIRQVTLTFVSRSYLPNRECKRVEKRLGTVVDSLETAGSEPGDGTGDKDAASIAAALKSWSSKARPSPRPACASSGSTGRPIRFDTS